MTNAEFESLVKQNYRYMRAIAWRKLRAWPDAEDAVQRALENLWRRVEHLDASDSLAAFSTLLVKATFAAAVDIIRERVGTKGDASGGRQRAEGAFASRHHASAGVPRQADETGKGRRKRREKAPEGFTAPPQEELARLHEALALIPPEYAAAMWEIYGHGAKSAEIANEMGMEPATLRQKLHRFKRDVREALDS